MVNVMMGLLEFGWLYYSTAPSTSSAKTVATKTAALPLQGAVVFLAVRPGVGGVFAARRTAERPSRRR
jgi:hypothetical protein